MLLFSKVIIGKSQFFSTRSNGYLHRYTQICDGAEGGGGGGGGAIRVYTRVLCVLNNVFLFFQISKSSVNMVARHPAALPALFASHQTPITLFSRFSSSGNLSIRSRLHHKCLAFDVIMTTILVRLGILTSKLFHPERWCHSYTDIEVDFVVDIETNVAVDVVVLLQRNCFCFSCNFLGGRRQNLRCTLNWSNPSCL